MFTVTFYQKYVALCAANKTKPSPAAQKMGISKTTVNRWKNGGGVTDANLQTIANYFGVSVDELRGDDPEKPSKKEKPTAQGDGLTEKDVALIKWFRSLPEEKLRAILVSQDAPEELLD